MDCKTTEKNSKRIILLGNGVNLVAGRNSDLLPDNVQKEYCRMENGELVLTPSFADRCQKIRPSFVHRALASLHEHVDIYQTTNYDYAMELALCGNKHCDKVIHIHGEADDFDHCIYSKSQYKEALEVLQAIDHTPGGEQVNWFEMLLNREVHICGLSLTQNEILLYYALHYRRNMLMQRADFDIDSSVKPIYAWLTFRADEKEATEKLASYLRGLSVRPILIPVYESDYLAAWERIVGKLMLLFTKNHVGRDYSQHLASFASPQSVTRMRNCSYSSVTDFKYPERCCFKISNPTLVAHSGKANWCFYCDLPEGLFFWSIPMPELLRLTDESRDEPYIRLYLNFSNGSLYFAPENSSQPAVLVASCRAISDIDTFHHHLLTPQN